MKAVASDLCLTGGKSGVVSIERDETLNELALFAGAGGGILGGLLCGFRTVCAVEIEPYCREVLMRRQDEGHIEPFPIWDDVRTFRGEEWRGVVDIVTGGFPCQDISVAGNGAGLDGERSGLWKEFARIVREVRPRYVLVENSPALTTRGLDRVLGDLAAMGYDAEWGVLGAIDAGAPHVRNRIWIVANAGHMRRRYGAKSGQEESTTPARCGQDDGWRQVSFASECSGGDEYEPGADCSICGLDYCNECRCPSPTQDGFEYCERDGVLYAKPLANTEG